MAAVELDATDRAIVRATQSGLPLVPRPYEEIARGAGITEAEVISRIERMLADGIIRRMGAVPNHFALGLDRNAMTVWDVEDASVSHLGREIGHLVTVNDHDLGHLEGRIRRLHQLGGVGQINLDHFLRHAFLSMS